MDYKLYPIPQEIPECDECSGEACVELTTVYSNDIVLCKEHAQELFEALTKALKKKGKCC